MPEKVTYRINRSRAKDIALWGTLLLLLALLPWLSIVEQAELRTQDVRFALRGPRHSHAKVVLIEIDDRTAQKWQPDPEIAWGPHLAALMRTSQRDGARVIGLDFAPAADTDDYLSDIVRHVMRSNGQSTSSILSWEARTADDPRLHPIDDLQQFFEDNPDHVVLGEAGKGTVQENFLDSSAPTKVGDVSLSSQPDGSVRCLQIGSSQSPTLVGALAQAAGKKVSPGTFWINYADLSPGLAIPTLSAEAVIADRLTSTQKTQLRGSIVLIGQDVSGSNDIQYVPGGRQFTGTEILAQGLSCVLDGSALRRPSRWAECAITLVAALLSLLSWRGLGVRPARFFIGVSALLLIAAAYLASAQAAFIYRFFLMPVAAPLVGLVVPFAAGHLRAALAERRLRRQIEATFVRYAGPRVRDYLLESARNQDLGGREVFATALFFDLRGSTTYAASRELENVVADLNALFARVIPPVLAGDGLIIRYTGDGFLAVFGALEEKPDHARAALAAVRAVIAQMTADPIWKCGIGVHSGPMLFGNLGSLDRLELTVIGDTVNVAARLQDAAKEFGCAAIISEAVFQGAGCPTDLTGPVSCPIRGRPEAMSVYLLQVGEEEIR